MNWVRKLQRESQEKKLIKAKPWEVLFLFGFVLVCLFVFKRQSVHSVALNGAEGKHLQVAKIKFG